MDHVTRLERDLERSQRDVARLIRAIRLTREYVDPASATSNTECLLPALPGWEWYDAWSTVDSESLQSYLNTVAAEPGCPQVAGVPPVGANGVPLGEWWAARSAEALAKIAPKIDNYGSMDLEIFGAVLNRMMGKPTDNAAANIELGCTVYALGKMCRLLAGYADGVVPNIDSAFDSEQYMIMLQRARETGSWPGCRSQPTPQRTKGRLWHAN